jgi:hypothetical protein
MRTPKDFDGRRPPLQTQEGRNGARPSKMRLSREILRLRMTMRNALSFHAVESFLEQGQVGRIP